MLSFLLSLYRRLYCVYVAIGLKTECSRRDDLESLAYLLIYFMRGTLPWRKLKGSTTAETWDLIRDKKLETAPLLTVGLPSEFEVFYSYVRGLEFGDLPDYEGLRQLFRSLAEREGIEYDGEFDWVVSGASGSTGGARSASGSKRSASVGAARRKRTCRACDAAQEAAATPHRHGRAGSRES